MAQVKGCTYGGGLPVRTQRQPGRSRGKPRVAKFGLVANQTLEKSSAVRRRSELWLAKTRSTWENRDGEAIQPRYTSNGAQQEPGTCKPSVAVNKPGWTKDGKEQTGAWGVFRGTVGCIRQVVREKGGAVRSGKKGGIKTYPVEGKN